MDSSQRIQDLFPLEIKSESGDYFQSVRFDQVRILLLDFINSTQSIAEQSSYPHNSNLSSAFRKKFGKSPESYLAFNKKT